MQRGPEDRERLITVLQEYINAQPSGSRGMEIDGVDVSVPDFSRIVNMIKARVRREYLDRAMRFQSENSGTSEGGFESFQAEAAVYIQTQFLEEIAKCLPEMLQLQLQRIKAFRSSRGEGFNFNLNLIPEEARSLLAVGTDQDGNLTAVIPADNDGLSMDLLTHIFSLSTVMYRPMNAQEIVASVIGQYQKAIAEGE